ncbi:unnamed protein product [Pleuronectes platessa]|uniref:Uncharacterized protein n=1 Tax=Pleuronectes platessa TaxID=8262 RepID=A0A9N7Y6V0_PLEPL|nr:unnamed protein product [Pleuronectes platessa]
MQTGGAGDLTTDLLSHTAAPQSITMQHTHSSKGFIGQRLLMLNTAVLKNEVTLVVEIWLSMGLTVCVEGSFFPHFRHKGSPMKELPVNQPVLENQCPPLHHLQSLSQPLPGVLQGPRSHPSNVSSFFLLTLLSRSSSLWVSHLHPARPH